MSFAHRALAFYRSLSLDMPHLPDITVLNPYRHEAVLEAVQAFLFRYYDDDNPRILIAGINPGRFGGGLTGISFTDPVALREHCGIPHRLEGRRELSSEFVYRVIEAMGGPHRFFRSFFLTALCPLGFLCRGRNYNYYDDPDLLQSVLPFIEETFRQQLLLGARTDALVVLGGGKNLQTAQRLNEKHGWVKSLVPLDHPRFIMQYRRKQLEAYLSCYADVLSGLMETGCTTT
ncbi:MAG: DUF4918 family protein [Chitinophagales bacterium]|nr:DUF4918 family protein [Chitinophagales bacterium]MDW8393852.1 DUF4918 family protein [Chitinophagales bacterium]